MRRQCRGRLLGEGTTLQASFSHCGNIILLGPFIAVLGVCQHVIFIPNKCRFLRPGFAKDFRVLDSTINELFHGFLTALSPSSPLRHGLERSERFLHPLQEGWPIEFRRFALLA